MSSFRLPNIPSLRAQQLHLEFASLQAAPPKGVYVTISPTDPTLWSGVLFVQNGPYASAILRFQIRFPPTYPDLPPLVTFNTDIFHPLVVPLTTYTFTTGSSDTDTVSATDDERLPPGGFSLRHGFPHWFGRTKRSAVNSAASSRNTSGNASTTTQDVDKDGHQLKQSRPLSPNADAESETASEALLSAPVPQVGEIRKSPVPTGEIYQHGEMDVPAVALLDYIRSTFDSEEILDSISLEAAGNPGAWHAWRTHRRTVKSRGGGPRTGEESRSGALNLDLKPRKGTPQSRQPGEWNWGGVWEKRVQNGIQNSYLESVLFGSSPRNTADNWIRFQKLDNDVLTKLKEEMIGPATN
ncbi:hypothetical protein D8B26_002895 [Coccidioides posadasii str. Silveira]|uniref:Ubiquitin-conjugating enzyme n=1 Tax=Coccidioides posadasii (strain RMSCC 757 / Silveira) TaxID=443226 RepID=E9CXW3_COCPS|nr:ubiquitin-conjugating enzyme [Coccidioides posadasii str. Silveira]QVM08202.1 hypothetical protein D8B26_002895 [Coccidioides posadasii str. Silveira]